LPLKTWPDEWDKANFGRLTKGAVYGFMSRAMLYAKRWDKAAEAAQKVIDKEGTLYGLMPNYADVFNQTDFCKETVMGYRFHGELTHSVFIDKEYSPKGDFPVTDTGGKMPGRAHAGDGRLPTTWPTAPGSTGIIPPMPPILTKTENPVSTLLSSTMEHSGKGAPLKRLSAGTDGFKPFWRRRSS